MTPWASVQDDLARYIRLYCLVSIALLALNFVDRNFQFVDVWQTLLPNIDVLWAFVVRTSMFGVTMAIGFLLNIKFWLILIQAWVLSVIVFWLLTKVLPVTVASLAKLNFARRKVQATPAATPTVKQGSPWAVVFTMTICLVATFHIIGRLIAAAMQSSGDYRTAQYFLIYPDKVALALSAVGILYAFIRSRGASGALARKMDVTMLPDDHPLTQRVHGFAAKLNLPMPAVGTMPVMNAYALGSKRGDQAVILGQPLLDMLSEEEVDAIIGHELGHIASNDMGRMVMAESYQAVIGGFFGFLLSLPARAATRNRSQAQMAQTLYVLGRTTIAGVSELIVKRMSRSREYVADRTGAMLTSPDTMMSALEKVTGSRTRYTPEENKYGYLMFRSSMRGSLLSTHPTFHQRRDSLLNFADVVTEQPVEGDDSSDTVRSLDPAALSTSLKLMAAVTIVGLGISYLWAQTALQQMNEAGADRMRSDAALRAVETRNASGLAAITAKQRQFETDQENWKTRQNTAIKNEEQAAQRIREANAAADRAKAEITRLDEIRRIPSSARLSYQVATAEPSAPPPMPAPQPVLVAAAPPPPPVAQPAPSSFPSVQSSPSGYQTATVVLPNSIAAPKPPSIPQPTVTQCDQLAANPTDPQRTVSDAGVSFPVLVKNTGPAIAACEEASASAPNSATQRYQLARALYAANRRDPRAEQLFAELVNRNYAASFDNLGQIYRNRGDIQNAARVYRLGVNAGDPDSMISLADLIRENKIAPRVENEGDYLYDLAASNGHKNAQKDVEERRARGAAIQTGVVVLKGLLGLR